MSNVYGQVVSFAIFVDAMLQKIFDTFSNFFSFIFFLITFLESILCFSLKSMRANKVLFSNFVFWTRKNWQFPFFLNSVKIGAIFRKLLFEFQLLFFCKLIFHSFLIRVVFFRFCFQFGEKMKKWNIKKPQIKSWNHEIIIWNTHTLTVSDNRFLFEVRKPRKKWWSNPKKVAVFLTKKKKKRWLDHVWVKYISTIIMKWLRIQWNQNERKK